MQDNIVKMEHLLRSEGITTPDAAFYYVDWFLNRSGKFESRDQVSISLRLSGKHLSYEECELLEGTLV